jgi:spoIIIJ-associated protein
MSAAVPLAARETLENILGHLGFAFSLEEEKRGEDQVLHVRMQNPSRLIGREGEVLDDLQFLLNRMLARGEEPAPRVIVDVENFRREQEAALLEEIRVLVDRVRTGGETVELPPMNGYERRIIHQAFKDDPQVETVSPEGPARLKRIRIRPRRPGKS